MGTKIFSFIFSTLRKRVNDPQNKQYWLPKVVAGIDKPGGGGKLLPLQGDSWNLGSITGTAGQTFRDTIMGQWWNSLVDVDTDGHQPIACPSQPWPRLDMPQVTAHGLDNVWLMDNPLMGQPGSGYTTTMTLRFGYYDGQNGLPTLNQILVEGKYSLLQCLCTASDQDQAPTACDNFIAPASIHGVGAFKIQLTDVYVDANLDIRVVGEGPARQIDIRVLDLTMRGGKPGQMPDLTVEDLTVETSWAWMSENVWLPQAQAALESEDGRQGLIANLNQALNEPDHRQKLADVLTQQFSKILDDNFGTVPAGALPSGGPQDPNPADQYLFDRVRLAVNNPASQFYLPAVVAGNSDPGLEPFHIDSVGLGDQAFGTLRFLNMQLQQVVLAGSSNIAAPPDQLSIAESVLDATLLVSTLAPPPQVSVLRGGVQTVWQVPAAPLLITGQFTVVLPGAPKDPSGAPKPLGGAFTLQVKTSQVLTTLAATGDDLDALNLTFHKLVLAIAPSDITVDVNIASVFRDVVNKLMNQDVIKQKVLDGLNAKLAGNLDSISRTATSGARKAIAAKLDQ
ncbi:MAG TPA: hypothetical protein VGK74_03735 [Symbiobacteriaceae bacterium]|jgi:hypothetical protein